MKYCHVKLSLYFKTLCVVYVFESVQILMCRWAFMCNSELLRNPVAVACSVLRVYVLCVCWFESLCVVCYVACFVMCICSMMCLEFTFCVFVRRCCCVFLSVCPFQHSVWSHAWWSFAIAPFMEGKCTSISACSRSRRCAVANNWGWVQWTLAKSLRHYGRAPGGAVAEQRWTWFAGGALWFPAIQTFLHARDAEHGPCDEPRHIRRPRTNKMDR